MSNTAPINTQIASSAPVPSGLAPVTAPLLPDQGVLTLMSNFPAQTYNLTMGSSIVKLMSTMTGPSGGGQLRQRSLVNRLRSSVSSTYYTDLDNSLGAVLGISRQLSESLPFNPYTTPAPSTGPSSWLAMAEADATYRDRLFQVLRAVSTYGPTAIGIKLIAESFLLAPCEVTEYFRGHSSSIIANPPLAYYITVTPHVNPTPQQRYGLMKILNKIKPALSTVTLAPAPTVEPYVQVNMRGAWASSFYWEVQSVSSSPSIYGSNSVPQYAFGSSQAAVWTVNGWVSGVLSYSLNSDGSLSTPSDFEQVTWSDGTITNYLPLYAMAPASEAILGTMVVPGNATSNPINSDNSTVSEILLAGASVSAIQAASTITAQNIPQFWSTPERAYTDMTQEVVEVRFSSPVNVNAVSFQLANFPQTATFQIYDDTDGIWVNYYQQTVSTSVPNVLPNPMDALAAKTHPQHFGAGHWVSVGFRFAPISFSRARIVLFRPGPAGPTGPYSAVTNSPAMYSLGVTEFSFDYIVDSATQLPDNGTVSLETIGTSTDVAGNTITYSVYSEVPGVATSGPDQGQLTQWRCFPQPVNNAVVNLYLDTRDSSDNPQVIDRFFITPTHLGVGCTLYFAIEEPGTPGDMSSLNWILVNRSYMLMTGWMTVPPIAARYWKFEMSGLVAEPLANVFPVTADILLYGNNAINPTTGSAGYQGALPAGATTQANMSAGETALTVPDVNSPPAGSYSAATALVAADPTLAQLLQSTFANYGYIDWQPFGAPPATLGGLEDYIVSTLASVNQVGFFTGFSSIVAYRSNPACPIDTPLYYECFYDASQIASANCQTEGGIYSGPGSANPPDNNPQGELLAIPAEVTSSAYVSASMILKVQFATNQSPPAEIVPFDTFRNGRYLPQTTGGYNWDDQQDWNIVGMGDVEVNFNAQTLTPIIVRGATTYTGPQANGIVSGPFLTSPVGFITFATRVSVLSVPPTNPEFFSEHPLYLQLCEWTGTGGPPTVLVEWPLSAVTVGQTVEEYFSYQVGSVVNASTFLCLAVAQHSGAEVPTGQTASWVVQAASGFDPSIVWAFSGDNVNWVNATSVNPIHNNRNGVVSISPNPATELFWRCTIYRPDMYVNLLKIRPWYQGTDRPRIAPVATGPNMSFSDPDQTIWTDPDFNTWTSPVPAWWFARYQQAVLFPDGVPIITPSSKVYIADVVETVGPANDEATVTYYMQMYHIPENIGPASDVATARATFHMAMVDTVGPATDTASGVITTLTPYTDLFSYTGGAQTWTCPQNIQAGAVTITINGGGGGGALGGLGGQVNLTLPVVPGQILNIIVGGQGQTYSYNTEGGYAYGYHAGGAMYNIYQNPLTYGQIGNWATLGFGGASSAVTNASGTLIAEAGAGGGQGWLFAPTEGVVAQNFGYVGGTQSWAIPSNISGPITATMTGAGGGANVAANRSVGASVTATVPTTPGHTLTVYVGGIGGDSAGPAPAPGGWGYGTGGTGGGYGQFQSGAAGGGSTAIVDASTGTLLLVAGAGGGSGESGGALGGAGGTPNGGAGGNTVSVSFGGGGGTQTGPGAGGSTNAAGNLTTGSSGSGPNGGAAASYGNLGGGGGGGGYFGGGGGGMWNQGGNAGQGAAGGGGSSFAIGSATGVSYSTQPSAANGTVSLSYITTNVGSPTYNYAQSGGNGGLNGTAGANAAFGSAYANGGGGATQSAGGAGGAWQSIQPSGNTTGTSPAGTVGAVGGGGINGGQAYPYAGGGGGGGGYAGGGAGAYCIYHAAGAWNTNDWSGGGGGSSWAGNGATNVSYATAASVGNGSISVSYNTSGPRHY
jgi:hypothetical protein